MNSSTIMPTFTTVETENRALREQIASMSIRLEQTETILDALPIMFWYKDKDNTHIRVNRNAANLDGLPITAVEGASADDLYPPEIAKAYHKDDLAVIESGEPKFGIIEKHESLTGETLWLETGKIPFREGLTGEIVGVIAFAVDITRQRHLQDTVRDSLEEIKFALEHGADPEAVLKQIDDLEDSLLA